MLTHMISLRSHIIVACGVVIAAPVAARAQGAHISAVSIAADQALLAEPLTGGAIGIRLPVRDTRVTLAIEATRARSSAGRIGTPCAGLIRPGSCPPEALRDNATLTSASAGAIIHVLRRPHALVALSADLTVASLRLDTRGLSSGQSLSATKSLWGGLIGAHASWTPVVRVPLALEIGVGIGDLMPFTQTGEVDGYTPFESGFGVGRARVGVMWQPSRQAR